MGKVLRFSRVLAGFVVAVGAGLAVGRVGAQSSTLPSSSNQCPVPLTLSVSPAAIVQGMVPLKLGVPPSTTTTTGFTVNRLIFILDGKPIGEGRQVSPTSTAWFMPWATQLGDQGNRTVGAYILYNSGQTCMSMQVPVTIQNPTVSSSTLSIQASPPQWSGLTSSSIDIGAQISLSNAEIPTTEIMQSAYIEWSTNIGSLTASRAAARFSSGSVAGNGRVLVKASYSGKVAQLEIPISVASQLAPPPPSSSSQTPPSTTGGSTSPPTSTTGSPAPTTAPTTTTERLRSPEPVPLTQEQKLAQISSQIDSQPAILSCAILNLSQARLDLLRTQARRLTATEFNTIRGCFAESAFVVPSTYAPVAPEDIKKGENVVESSDTTINDATSDTAIHPETGSSTTKLRFQGQAKPNSDVLLYVFSEPLVLYAKADDKGNWVYDLIDPLTPGTHEAYAVVEAETGTYKKSSPFSFLIETAQASSENPSGYSLSVKTVSSLAATPSKRRANLYALGAVTLVCLVTVFGLILVLRTLKHVPNEPTDTQSQ